ncbi:hypothetical protein REPUB_Repub01dG0101200 [Reevesia pubescens]
MKNTLSDHILLVLQWQSVNWGPKPFRFYNWWMNTRSYEKLGKVKTEAGKIRKNVDIIEEELDNLLMVSDADEIWNEVVFGEKTSALWKEYSILESMWKQKSRIKWLREGDQNSRFFHSICKMKNTRNNFAGLKINRVWEDDPDKGKRGIYEHYAGHFSESCWNRPFIDDLDFLRVG